MVLMLAVLFVSPTKTKVGPTLFVCFWETCSILSVHEPEVILASTGESYWRVVAKFC